MWCGTKSSKGKQMKLELVQREILSGFAQLFLSTFLFFFSSFSFLLIVKLSLEHGGTLKSYESQRKKRIYKYLGSFTAFPCTREEEKGERKEGRDRERREGGEGRGGVEQTGWEKGGERDVFSPALWSALCYPGPRTSRFLPTLFAPIHTITLL